MRLPELSDLPSAPPREACYALRAAGPADHGQLAELLSEAFGDKWDAKRVAAEFSPGNGVEATYVVVSPAGGVATDSTPPLPGGGLCALRGRSGQRAGPTPRRGDHPAGTRPLRRRGLGSGGARDRRLPPAGGAHLPPARLCARAANAG